MSEANFDSIVGPTHNYAGLSAGNVASTSNRGKISRPKEAALQGLAKMRTLAEMGVWQGYLPPQQRPHLASLRSLGFSGSDPEILNQVAKTEPLLLARVSSSSSMWAANAATVSSSDDSADQKVHLSIANLQSMFHRMIEAPQTERNFRAIFSDQNIFKIHAPLLNLLTFSDEGAANHTRFHPAGASPNGSAGIHFFVFGRGENIRPIPKIHPARQSLEASMAIARRHQLAPSRVLYAQQNPDAIDAGVFHNDVISVGHGNLFLYHELSFVETPRIISTLKNLIGDSFETIMVKNSEISVEKAVKTYLFNSQIVTDTKGKNHLIAPIECEEDAIVREKISSWISDSKVSIDGVHYLNLRESMKNGGGPACLRLRVPLHEHEWHAVNPACRYSPEQHLRLETWVKKHYRDELSADDLHDPNLLKESLEALDELTQILNLGSVYEFQTEA